MCRKICKLIQEADYVIIDLTEENPNVYYELGLAWGLNKNIFIMCHRRQHKGVLLEIINNYNGNVFQYDHINCFDDKPNVEIAGVLIHKSIRLSEDTVRKENRSPSNYISHQQICLFTSGLSNDGEFYIDVVKQAQSSAVNKIVNELNNELEIEKQKSGIADNNKIKELNANIAQSRKEWTTKKFRMDLTSTMFSLNTDMIMSKIWIIDLTSYQKQIDPVAYFVLGLGHGMGRDVIPFINKAMGNESIPFDVRGLWQIYFDRLDKADSKDVTFNNELVNIISVLHKSYVIEQQNYPLRDIWDKILKAQTQISIFTCARATAKDNNRKLGRTHVDKWDYWSVAWLTRYISQNYKHTNVEVKEPVEKDMTITSVKLGEEFNNYRQALVERITQELKDTKDSIIIIGSPDVSDYAEVVLSKIYMVNAYSHCEGPSCEPNSLSFKFKKWLADKGYLYNKHTKEVYNDNGVVNLHPRQVSTFFYNTSSDVTESVIWNNDNKNCVYSEDSRVGSMFSVLTIFKDKADLFGRDDRWIIIISGFSGIGTFALAKLLTEGDQLYNKIINTSGSGSNPRFEKNGVHVLVNVNYHVKSDKNGDCQISSQPASVRSDLPDKRELNESNPINVDGFKYIEQYSSTTS